MPDYKNGKLYKLQCDDGYYYIGSTCNELRFRFNGHKTSSKIENSRVYQHINEIGWDRVRIVLIEDFPCENKEQLRRREDELIQQHLNNELCLNFRREFVTTEEKKQLASIYYQEIKEERKVKDKERYLKNKDKIREQQREYEKRNRALLTEKQRIRRAEKRNQYSSSHTPSVK